MKETSKRITKSKQEEKEEGWHLGCPKCGEHLQPTKNGFKCLKCSFKFE